MHFWGLTIDTVSCINLVLAIGLCVDYAAHVAHTFMTKTGTKDERAEATIASIGPAVFHGGFSTFLAFIFLAGSDSHVFITFFKVYRELSSRQITIFHVYVNLYVFVYLIYQIFILVVVYGLFHGLIFLPVLLSLVGPEPFIVDETSMEMVRNPSELGRLQPQLIPRQEASISKKDDSTVRCIL